MSLLTAIEAFVVHLRDERLRAPATVAEYRMLLNRFAAWAGKTPLERVDPLAWIRHLRGRSASRNTIRTYLILAARFYRWAHREGWIASNPFEDLQLPRGEFRLPSCPTDEEVRAAFAACARLQPAYMRIQMPAVLAAMAGSGLRKSEVLNLSLQSVQFYASGQGLLRLWGKGDKERVVLIASGMAPHWRAWLDARAALGGAHQHIFCYGGHPMGERALYRQFHALRDLAGIPPRRFHPHALRHYYATGMLRYGGANLHVVQQALGHASPETTTIYLHLLPDDAAAATEAVGRALLGADPALPSSDGAAPPPVDKDELRRAERRRLLRDRRQGKRPRGSR